MLLFFDRYFQKDFFIFDIFDVVLKDDMVLMEYLLFLFVIKLDMCYFEYCGGDNWLKIVLFGVGLFMIFDKDILIFCVSQFMYCKNWGEKIGKWVCFSVCELMIIINCKMGGIEYQCLEQVFQRFIGIIFQIDIQIGNKCEICFFSLFELGSGFVMKEEGKWWFDYCEVILFDWVMCVIEGDEVVMILNDYFCLCCLLECCFYEIGCKYCGSQLKWQIGFVKFQEKIGSNVFLKKF